MRSISGVELDYDGGVMSFDEVLAKLTDAGLAALIYTSPSHSLASPRWRVLLPASRNDLPREERRALAARVNGVLGGICASESFTLSQSFYYGSIVGAPDHRAEIVDGDFIDLRGDLDAGAIGRPNKPGTIGNQADQAEGADNSVFDIPATGYMDAEIEELLAEPLAKGHRSTRFAHATKLAVEKGMTAADFEALCREHPDGCAQKYLPPERSDELRKRIAEIWAPHAAHMAAVAAKPLAPAGRRLCFNPFSPKSWSRRCWSQSIGSLEDFIPSGTVTGLFGDGGTGKDLLLFQLATCALCGAHWLGKEVKPGRVLYFPVEDTRKELRRRQAAIAEHYDIRFASFPRQFKITPLIGKDAVLAAFEQRSGVVKQTALYAEIRKQIEEFRCQPTLVILPNRVNIFGVNQNDDAQARQSMQYLYAIAEDYATSVIMPGHVSLSGMSSDSGTSGSVQWSNACRSRLYLSRITEDHGEELDPDARFLTVKKANWGPTNLKINMRWSQGVFVPDTGAAQTFTGMQAAKDADLEFLRMLDLTIDNLSLRPSSHNYAPKIFSEDIRCRLRGRRGKKAFAAAMDRLVLRGVVKTEAYGPPSKRHERIVCAARPEAAA